MPTARSIRSVILVAALAAAVGWLAYSIHGLIHATNVYHVRVIEPTQHGTTEPTTRQADALEASQNTLGEHTMIAIASIAFLLMLIFVNTFLRDRRPPTGGIGGQ